MSERRKCDLCRKPMADDSIFVDMCKHFEAFRFLPSTPTIKERCIATFRGEINGLQKLLKLLK